MGEKSPPLRAPTFGTRLRTLRAATGLSQAALAERSGVPLRTLQKYEIGTHEPPYSVAVALAGALGVPVGAFAEAGK